MQETDPDDVYATVVRSPIHDATWVPFIPDGVHWDCASAGPLRRVKEATNEMVEQRRNDDGELVWRKAGPDTWELVLSE